MPCFHGLSQLQGKDGARILEVQVDQLTPKFVSSMPVVAHLSLLWSDDTRFVRYRLGMANEHAWSRVSSAGGSRLTFRWRQSTMLFTDISFPQIEH
jgi:hypothetical protein